MNLVIVESPAKGKTISKFLGPGYKVLACFGHIRDLPKKEFGVAIEKDFKPKYVIIPKAKKIISFLKKEAEKTDSLILATDFDREGEAIAFHLQETLKEKSWHRITFTEITKEAIKNALKNPREIDINLVSSQQARRVLDRLVGYKLSPLLWKKVAFGLSAGRVQSVALRLVVEREREIESFVPEEFWRIVATLLKGKTKKFDALLVKKDDKPIEKLSIKTETDAQKILDDLKEAEYRVKSIEQREKRIYPYPPFITSTLQQEAFFRLGFSAKKTMFLAQQLYENGFISYHRTDSTNLSQLALNSIRKYIKENFADNLPSSPRFYKTKVLKAQEAHEAIRPTYIKNSNLKTQISNLTEDHQKLYDLIWRRTVACQMKEALVDQTIVEIKAKNYLFRAEGQTLKFDGFTRIYPIQIKEIALPLLQLINELLKLIKLSKEQHFTKPPSRFTEATLIKKLEKEGIGRPSTYAPILSTVEERGYVGKSAQYLFPKEIGFLVSDLLLKHFPDIVDTKFTARMEEELDRIAEGRKRYKEVCQDFWEPFSKNLAKKEKQIKKQELIGEETKEICQKCGSKMVVKLSRFGKFLSCSRFPTCKNKKPFVKLTGIKCPNCQKGEVIERQSRRGKTFWGCSRYPECSYISGEKPTK